MPVEKLLMLHVCCYCSLLSSYHCLQFIICLHFVTLNWEQLIPPYVRNKCTSLTSISCQQFTGTKSLSICSFYNAFSLNSMISNERNMHKTNGSLGNTVKYELLSKQITDDSDFIFGLQLFVLF